MLMAAQRTSAIADSRARRSRKTNRRKLLVLPRDAALAFTPIIRHLGEAGLAREKKAGGESLSRSPLALISLRPGAHKEALAFLQSRRLSDRSLSR